MPDPDLVGTEAWQLAEALLDDVTTELAKAYLPAPDFRIVLPGNTVVIDHAGNANDGGCTELLVWMETSFPVDTHVGFPTPSQLAGCANEMAYLFHVGIYRCLEAEDDQTFIPTPEEQNHMAGTQFADQLALRRAIQCWARKRQYQLQTYAPFGPEGNVYGGDWAVLVGGQK